MSDVLQELVALLALERIEHNLFRGQSQNFGRSAVFGGQVLGQALSAAVQTVPPERHVHSLHAYFLRPGDVSKPIVYDVDRSRDGGSFTTRRVVAIQNGQPIFNLAASFQTPEQGFEHQRPMPIEVVDPRAIPEAVEKHPFPFVFPAFELRFVEDIPNGAAMPTRRLWLKAAGRLPDDPALHAYLLAYASDFGFLTTALLPHGVSFLDPNMQVASIDHSMWFHRPFRMDDWLLYSIESPSAQGARGLVFGHVYTRSGELVATATQEGLIRRRP